MACFLVPAAEAIVTTAAAKIAEKKENAEGRERQAEKTANSTSCFSRKLKTLSNFLWGGSALLAFEHIWHGEITPFFPFLTAAGSSADLSEMLHEMSTVGVGMAVLVTVFSVGVSFAADSVLKRQPRSARKD